MSCRTKYLVLLSGFLIFAASYPLVSGSNTGSEEVIRGYYVWVTDIRPVGDIVLGQNVTMEVDIEYNFLEVPLVPTIMDQDFEVRGETSDVIQGYGNTTYTISMKTKETDDTAFFAVIAYYYIDGNWTYMDPHGYLPFTLGQGTSDVSEGVELPDEIDFSDIDIDEITNKLNETIQKGLELIEDVEIPDEISDIEDTIKEQTGIPGYPAEALVLGAAALLAARKRS